MAPTLSYAVLDDRGVIEVAGTDRVAFLQGLVSNDVARAGPDHAIHAAFLTAQGRYLHDFFIVARGETLLLETEAGRRDDLRRRLSLYRLRSKVTVGDASDRWRIVAAFGAGALDALGLGGEAGAARAIGGGIAFADPRLAALGARLLLPREAGLAALEALGFAPAGANDYDRLRLAHGVPDGSRDLAVEKALLLEAGFDELNGIDWQKGCYIGQELTARMKYRALVKKRLLPVEVEGTLPPADTPVMLGAEEVGEVRSGNGSLALAVLRLDAVATGAVLTAGEARLKPRRPSWMTG